MRRNGCPKGCFWRVHFFSAPLRFALKTPESPENLKGAETKRTLQEHPFGQPFLRTTPSPLLWSTAAKPGFQTGGGSRSGLVLPFLSFLGLSRFSGFSRFARGISGGFPDSSLFLILGLLRAPTRNSPERVRNTIWTFPEKSGNPPGLETPRFSFSQYF